MDEYSIYVDEVSFDGKVKNIIVFEKLEDKNKFFMVLIGEEVFWKDSVIIIKEL